MSGNKWKKDGGCVLGQACPFAHGEKEIGTVALVVCEKVITSSGPVAGAAAEGPPNCWPGFMFSSFF